MADRPQDREMPLTGHLLELRKRLKIACIALGVSTVACFAFAKQIFFFLAVPLRDAFGRANVPLENRTLHAGSLTEGFWTLFSTALYAGIFLASPVIFHQVWKFIAPGLYEREKKVAVPFAIVSALFFIGGALFCYFFVLPATMDFLIGYSNDTLSIWGEGLDAQGIKLETTLFIEPYFAFTKNFLIAFGFVFELPLLIFFLSMIGLVTHKGLWKFNKYAIILSFIIGAILTPGPDIVSQLLMAGPLVVLYNLSIIVAYIVTKRKARAAADAAAGDASAAP